MALKFRVQSDLFERIIAKELTDAEYSSKVGLPEATFGLISCQP